jgi:hypothetical protein
MTITLDEDRDIVEAIPSEEEDNEAGVPIYRILSYPADYTLKGLYDKLREGEISIQPFQRGWVWSHAKASKLIESFLVGLPVPGIFLYKEPSQKQLVIDGQQRLRTICAFFEGKLPDGSNFHLKDVSPQWQGKYYEDLDEPDKIRLRDSVLRSVIVEQLHPEDNSSIYHIFERLNTGGMGLTPQEVRNCVYHGPLNDLVVELNENSTWRTIFGSSKPDPRMRDVELIVRFFALWEDSGAYSKPMKGFLNAFMDKRQWESDVEPYRKIFVNTVENVAKSLGDKPFHRTRGINAAILDSVMVAFAKSSSIPEDIPARFQSLKEDLGYQDAISVHTTDDEKVASRVRLAEEVLFS